MITNQLFGIEDHRDGSSKHTPGALEHRTVAPVQSELQSESMNSSPGIVGDAESVNE